MKKSKLPSPDCTGGYTIEQVENIMGPRIEEFWRWMNGQTMMLCEGQRYNHETREYEEDCGGIAHGPVTYTWDLQRFLDGRPVID